MKIKPTGSYANLKNLFNDALARAWTTVSLDALMEKMGGELGAVYQDGGTPVSGMARALDPDDWDNLIKKLLMTDET